MSKSNKPTTDERIEHLELCVKMMADQMGLKNRLPKLLAKEKENASKAKKSGKQVQSSGSEDGESKQE